MTTQQPARPSGTTNATESSRAATAKVNVQLPATVVSYDSATQKATVKIVPCFRRRDAAAGNAVVCYRPPDIPGVPVEFPGAGPFSITWPIAVGTSGVLSICDRSIDEWKQVGGTKTEPQDTRRHDLSDGVFRPGVRSFAEVIPGAGLDATAMVLRAAEMKLGSSAASAYVALANLVLSELQAIWLKFNTHTHLYTPGTLTPIVTAVPTDLTGSASSVAATKVKAE